MFAPVCLFGEGSMEARANIFFAAALGLCALCTHKSPRRVRFRANRTLSQHRRIDRVRPDSDIRRARPLRIHSMRCGRCVRLAEIFYSRFLL
jgi:hypothetical protein